MPKRIQIRRDRPWQTTPKAIKVDRSTPWGNPYKKGEHGTAEHCVRLYIASHTDDAAFRARIRQELAGKDLACWCKPDDWCHADVLLRWANEWPLCSKHHRGRPQFLQHFYAFVTEPL